MSGMLTEDHDGNSCQTLATTACSRRVKRFNPAQNKVRNLVRKHTAHIARKTKTKTINAASHGMGGVAKAEASPRAVPYFVTSRARLSRRFRNHVRRLFGSVYRTRTDALKLLAVLRTVSALSRSLAPCHRYPSHTYLLPAIVVALCTSHSFPCSLNYLL